MIIKARREIKNGRFKSNMKAWRKTKLSELTLKITDGKHGDCENEMNSGYYFVSCKDIKDKKINYEKARQIKKIDFDETAKRTNLESGDILLTNSGTIGRLAIAEDINLTKRTTFQKSVAIIKPNKKIIFPEFLYYNLLANKKILIETAVGTTQQNLLLKDIKDFMICICGMDEQKAIAKILSDLDAKIELNQKMNKTLEAIAQTIFKHWFIDFEFPNKDGKPYKSSGGEMVDSELGEIPEGWEVKKIFEVGTLKNGINYTREERGEKEIYIVNVRDVANNKFIIKDDLAVIKLNPNKYEEYLLNQNDIVIARSASPGESSLILGDIDNVIHSGFTIRYRLDNSYLKLYMYMILQNSKNILSRYSVGTALKSVNQATIGNIQFIMPTIDILIKFNSNYIFNKIGSNLLESKALFTIRDFLLPKLMSGKIRVPLED